MLTKIHQLILLQKENRDTLAPLKRTFSFSLLKKIRANLYSHATQSSFYNFIKSIKRNS